MKSEDATTLKEAWLEVYEITNNQAKDELLCIQTQIATYDKDTSNVSHKLVVILER